MKIPLSMHQCEPIEFEERIEETESDSDYFETPRKIQKKESHKIKRHRHRSNSNQRRKRENADYDYSESSTTSQESTTQSSGKQEPTTKQPP